MKINIIIMCAAMILPLRTFAQYNSDAKSYSKKAQRALATKRTGAAITLLGTLALVTGMIVDNNNIDDGVARGMGGLTGRYYHRSPIWIVGPVNHKSSIEKLRH